MEEQTQISPQGPALYLTLSSFQLLRNLPFFISISFAFIILIICSHVPLSFLDLTLAVN